MNDRRGREWRYGLFGLIDMRENGTPAPRVALLGFAAGAVAGFLSSLLYMWFDTEAGQAFAFDWPKAVTSTIFVGLMVAVTFVLNVRNYREKAARTASGSTERATSSEIR